MKYFSTFITGFQDVVGQAIKDELPDVNIHAIADGLITYETSVDLVKVQKLKFLNNSYLLLAQGNNVKDLMTSVLHLNKEADYSVIKQLPQNSRIHFFRVTASKANQTTPIPWEILHQVETKITKQLDLKIHRTLPDIEFWFFQRDDGVCLLGARLAGKLGKPSKDYEKGELRQELAHLLVRLSSPNKEDVVLDPFAGSGSILFSRVQDFPYKKMYATEIDSPKAESLIRKTSWGKEKIHITSEDALNLTSIPNNSIDKIITDPPWGEFIEQSPKTTQKFNQQMFSSFDRVLKKEGTVVLLFSRQIPLEPLANNFRFSLIKKLDILVNGKKASVYVLQKN